jgi:hypothetical protein
MGRMFPKAMKVAHAHADVELNWLVSGQMTYAGPGRRWQMGAGELGVFGGSVPHQLRAPPDCTRGVCATLPLA